MSKIIPLRGEGFYRNKADEMCEKGMRAVANGDYEQALACFEAAYRFCPDHTDARFHSGLVAYLLNQKEKAIAIFEHLHNEHPENHEYTYRYARGMYENGEEIKSAELFQTIPTTHEHYPQAQFYRAKALYQQQDKSGAVHAFISLLSRFPKRADIRFELAAIYAEIGKYTASISELKTCLALDEAFVLAYYLLHDIYVEMGNYDEAVETLQTLGKKCPVEQDLVKHRLAILDAKRKRF